MSDNKLIEDVIKTTGINLAKAERLVSLGHWDWDLITNNVKWSDGHFRIFGYTVAHGTETYEMWRDRIHPEDIENIERILRENKEKDTGYNWDYRLLFPDGSVRYIHAEADSPVKDAFGNPVRWFGTVQDITELKRIEDSLREKEKHFRLLSEVNSLLLSSKDPKATVQTIAKCVMHHLNCDVFFNYICDEIHDRLHLNAYGGINAEAVKEIEWLDKGEAICGCVASEGCRIVSGDVQHNGDKRAELVRSMGIQAYACHPLHMGEDIIGTLSFGTKSRKSFTEDELALMSNVADKVSIAIDRMRVEYALRISEERFRALVTASSEVVYRMSPDWKEMLFLRGRKFIPNTCSSNSTWLDIYIHAEDQLQVTAVINEAIRTKSDFKMEHRVLQVDGTIGWTFSHAVPIFDVNGEIIEWFGAASNITERKRAEEVMRRANDELEKRVMERTAELKKSNADLIVQITERRQVEEELRESQTRLENELMDTKLLQTISAELLLENNIQELYEKIIDVAVTIMHSDYASMQMLYPERGNGGELCLLAFRGFNPYAAKFWEWVNADSESSCGIALRTGKRVICPDIENCDFMDGSEDQATYIQTGIHAVQTTPLISRAGKVVGMISTHWCNLHEPSERDLRLLDILARQAADLIERKKAEEALKIANETLEERVQERTEELEKAYMSLREIDVVRKQEIHHRIKNNLQVISSLLDLQAEKFTGKQDIEDSQVLEAFKESQDRIISMALIHEELHKGEKLDTLNFSTYIKELADNLFLSYRFGNEGTSLSMDIVEDIFFDMDTAVPLGIIINELVSNSLKHAFPDRDNGEIQIKLHRENGKCKIEGNKSTNYVLSVLDNGIGIPEDINIEDLDSSLGLQLVTTLVDQLDGELEIKKNKGTGFIIRFTVPESNNLILAKHSLQLTDND